MTHETLGSNAGMGESAGFVTTQHVRLYDEKGPFVLESGETLAPVDVAYETYGQLNAERSNAIVICHALTGDAHVAGNHGEHKTEGWWDSMIGPGKPVDTSTYFVVSSNLLGGCSGTTGPSSIDPATGKPYGLRFPYFSVRDLVEVQRRLLQELGIERLYAGMGGSLGAMQILQWALDHPGEMKNALLICASSRLTPENIAFSSVARNAIMRDVNFQNGDYYGTDRQPDSGLSVARMLAHITYVSGQALEKKFGRERRDAKGPTFGIDFQIESYLDHQGEKFLKRFDANTYLYLSRVMDYFDPFADEEAAVERLRNNPTRFLIVSFDTDWRFSTSHSLEIARLLERAGCDFVREEIASPWGHDSFLLPVPDYHQLVRDFLAGKR